MDRETQKLKNSQVRGRAKAMIDGDIGTLGLELVAESSASNHQAQCWAHPSFDR